MVLSITVYVIVLCIIIILFFPVVDMLSQNYPPTKYRKGDKVVVRSCMWDREGTYTFTIVEIDRLDYTSSTNVHYYMDNALVYYESEILRKYKKPSIIRHRRKKEKWL